MQGRKFAPKGVAFEAAVAHWSGLKTDSDAQFDKEYRFDATDISPMVTYGTNPGMGIPVEGNIPGPEVAENVDSFNKSLQYMGLESGQSLLDKPIEYVFIGSCTNSRIEDLRMVAGFVKGKKKAEGCLLYTSDAADE